MIDRNKKKNDHENTIETAKVFEHVCMYAPFALLTRNPCSFEVNLNASIINKRTIPVRFE